ncbi:MAG TPA: hypothetical protein DEP72_09460 [Clostridiales bacterium]|nr:MAG: hypothetical protein A2Y18_04070 [Clostridiales bacterium GWD2_32_19]HCC08368.1 hypothetical protein [Clostridiales bacterium]
MRKNLVCLVVVVVVVVMFMSVVNVSLASSSSQKVDKSTDSSTTSQGEVIIDTDEEKTGAGGQNSIKSINDVGDEKAGIEVRYRAMNKIMNAYKVMLKSMEGSSATDKEAKVERLKLKIANLEQSKVATRNKLTESKEALKERIMNTYTEEEKTKLGAAADALKQYKNIAVLPYQNVYAKEKEIKFDTPPVIKEGRTLIPVRAIATAYGFEVSYNEETKEVTLIKDGNEIKLCINSREAYANGTKIELDVPAETYNDRTVIPLRFVAENMGLNVDWDEETQTIDISEEEEVTDEDTAEDLTEEELDAATEQLE